jgi:hypothetical protein
VRHLLAIPIVAPHNPDRRFEAPACPRSLSAQSIQLAAADNVGVDRSVEAEERSLPLLQADQHHGGLAVAGLRLLDKNRLDALQAKLLKMNGPDPAQRGKSRLSRIVQRPVHFRRRAAKHRADFRHRLAANPQVDDLTITLFLDASRQSLWPQIFVSKIAVYYVRLTLTSNAGASAARLPRPISNCPWGFEPRDLTRFGMDGSARRGRSKSSRPNRAVRSPATGDDNGVTVDM